MTTEIKVPTLPESVTDATIATWYKKPGEFIKRDEHLVDIETDKVVLEVVAPNDGVLESILKPEGTTVKALEVIGSFKEGAKESSDASGTADKKDAEDKKKVNSEKEAEVKKTDSDKKELEDKKEKESVLTPSVRRLLAEHNLDASQIQATGDDGKITKEDIQKFLEKSNVKSTDKLADKEASSSTGTEKSPANETTSTSKTTSVTQEKTVGNRTEKRVAMTRLRARIADRLVEVQNTAAILTSFNEINMEPVMQLRQKYKDSFEKTYGVRLGFMSFFTVAVVEALKQFPIINASIDGNDIIYHGYYDIGIAVSSPRGLVVPIVRDADLLSMAEIEKVIVDLSNKARAGQLTMEEITGGTFTITNGGVFGSLMSTPIINPPQSGILGMHKIQERPVVENGQIVIRPMMYIALSYDHRIIDGSEAVRFLVMIKELLEDPARLALKI